MSAENRLREDEPSLSLLRRTAKVHSWLCPGAGFAYLGLARLATLTFAATVALLPATAWLTFQPEALSACTLLGVFVVAVSLNAAEQFIIRKASPRPPGPSFLVGGFYLAAVAIWAAAVGTLALFLTGFGSVQLAGSGMSPTLQKGERLLYAKRANTERLGRGSIVIFRLSEKSAWGQPGWLTVERILAVPGDRMAIRDRSYSVNGGPGPLVAVTKPFAPILHVPEEPESITVPAECYFIVQDDPLNSYDSRVLFWMESKAVASDQQFRLSGQGLFTRVE